MAHHVQGIHYSDEAFNVVKGGFPSYSRKQSHPAVIWALNQLELWILWNAGFFPLNEWMSETKNVRAEIFPFQEAFYSSKIY